jgi:thiol-disulfide isomerase/thioredoxin
VCIVSGDVLSLSNEARSQDGKKVAYFTATWCGPCRMIAPNFTALSDEIDGVGFMKVDIDQNQEVVMGLTPALTVCSELI